MAPNSSGVRKTKRCAQRQKTGLGHNWVKYVSDGYLSSLVGAS